MLYAFGKGEVPISVSALPLVHTIRAVGAVSAALCDARRGDVLGVRGPFGTAWPVEAAEGADVVVLTGGIGLAPLRPVVHHLLAHRERYGRVVVLYGGRSPEELLYTAELERWRGRFDVEVAGRRRPGRRPAGAAASASSPRSCRARTSTRPTRWR